MTIEQAKEARRLLATYEELTYLLRDLKTSARLGGTIYCPSAGIPFEWKKDGLMLPAIIEATEKLVKDFETKIASFPPPEEG